MKKIISIVTALLATMTMTAQTLNVVVGEVTYQVPAAQAGNMTYVSGSTLTILGKTFDTSSITRMYIDNSSVTDNTVSVAYNGTAAAVTVAGNAMKYLDVKANGSNVCILQDESLANEITYTLSGSSTNGSFYMNGKYKASLVLNGLTLTSADSAAINIRNGKRISVELASGTTNTLVDCSNGSQKACFAVKGHTEFKGGGTLNITGKTAHAFWGKEYVQLKASTGTINILGAVSDGFNVNQYFQQNGGTVNISNVGDDGIQVSYKTDDNDVIEEDDENTGEFLFQGGTLKVNTTATASKGIKAEGYITINEEKATSIITSTNSGGVLVEDNDSTSSSCMKSDIAIVLDAGTVTLTNTGQGGRAMNCDGTITINGGTLNARAEGDNFGSSGNGGFFPFAGGGGQGGGGGPTPPGGDTSNSKNAKCIKSKGDLTITGGTVTAYSKSHEGMESKANMYISGGTVNIQASDDAINSSGNMQISGGYTYAYSTSNDGLDSNGNMEIKGGVAVAFGAGGAETGIDIDEQHALTVTGGYLFGIGGRVDARTSGCTQTVLSGVSASCNSGYFVIKNDNTNIFAVKVPTSYSGIVMASAPTAPTSIGTATSVSGTEINGVVIF